MKRPEVPKLVKGYGLWVHRGQNWTPVKVVSVGPKHIGVIPAEHYDEYLSTPITLQWRVRKFSCEDMLEGERGKRFGSTASLVTNGQRKYDALIDSTDALLRERAGISFRHDSPFSPLSHPERLIELADAIAPLLDRYGQEG